MMHSPITAADIAPRTPLTMADACRGCRTGAPLAMAITMAFQPIVDIETGSVFAYEALVRGADGRSAGEVLSDVGADMTY